MKQEYFSFAYHLSETIMRRTFGQVFYTKDRIIEANCLNYLCYSNR